MLGAIIGDIVGSVYEFHPVKTKEFPLFSAKSRFTDDTVMTLAVAEGLMNGGSAEDFVAAMRKYGAQYWRAGYGQRFSKWLCDDHPAPYNSYGNGSAMRLGQGIHAFGPTADNFRYLRQYARRIHGLFHFRHVVNFPTPENHQFHACSADGGNISRLPSRSDRSQA
jgi:ADP-ribosylglycohydrolase